MDTKERFTVTEMQTLLQNLRIFFDLARLVDPQGTALLDINEDGGLVTEPYSCFQVWNRQCRCADCSSLRALTDNCKRSKYEFILNDVFYVVSRPVTLVCDEGERHVVLEIVSHVSDQMSVEREKMDLVRRLDMVQEKVYQDDLTHVYNRRYFNEFAFLRQMDQFSRRVGFIVMDLSQFKTINDTYGHLVGDQLLERVAGILRHHIRSQDSVIRMGGDEFLVTLLDCGEEAVRRKVEELGQALGEVTAADFGYAWTDRFEPTQSFLKQLMDEADQEMYKHKRARKSRAGE